MATVSDMFSFLPIHPRLLLIIGVIDFWAGRNIHASKGLEGGNDIRLHCWVDIIGSDLGFLSVTSILSSGVVPILSLQMFLFIFSFQLLWIFSFLSCKLIESRSLAVLVAPLQLTNWPIWSMAFQPETMPHLPFKKKSLSPLLCRWSMLHFLNSLCFNVDSFGCSSVITSPGE